MASRAQPQVDTPDNRAYIQKHRLWLLGEVMTMTLMLQKPEKPLEVMVQTLQKENSTRTEAVDPPAQEVIAESKTYLQENKVAQTLEEWLRALIDAKPENPIQFSIDHFNNLRGAAETATADGRKKPKVLVVFHPTCNIDIAKAISSGVTDGNGVPTLRRIADEKPPNEAAAALQECSEQDFNDADAVVFGVPPQVNEVEVQTLVDTIKYWGGAKISGKIGGVFAKAGNFLPALGQLGFAIADPPSDEEIAKGAKFGSRISTAALDAINGKK